MKLAGVMLVPADTSLIHQTYFPNIDRYYVTQVTTPNQLHNEALYAYSQPYVNMFCLSNTFTNVFI
jgi:hypothetical protein